MNIKGYAYSSVTNDNSIRDSIEEIETAISNAMIGKETGITKFPWYNNC